LSVEQANLNDKTIQRVHRVTVLILFAAIVFYLFFQINKGGPFRDINPFGQDPYDAVGSFAFQGALLIGLLTYARALRLRDDPAQATKTRLILRGNVLIVFAILVTLIADAIAEILHPLPPSYWGNVLLVELALMFLLALTCVMALTLVFKRIQTVAPPRDLTPADGIDDLWTLVRVPVTKSSVVVLVPRGFVEWVTRLNSDWLFSRVQWLNPRTHPWRFACALGLLVGVGLTLAQLQQGLPPDLRLGAQEGKGSLRDVHGQVSDSM
jgi:hypothetical protein